jgi:hypothetical protein
VVWWVVGVAALLAGLVEWHARGVNGPWYWAWMWQRVPVMDGAAWVAVAAVPLVVGQWIYGRWRGATAVGLALAMASLVGMEVAAARRPEDPLAARRVVQVVGDTAANSYFRQAGVLLHDGLFDRPRWAAEYPARMPGMWLHAQTHPPGFVLFYVPLIRAWGYTQYAAMVSGWVMAGLATLAVPAAYLMLRGVVRDRAAAFHGACLMALSPGLVLFFPTWDEALPVATAAVVWAWVRAVDTGRARYAVAYGAALAAACFVTFNLLVLGVFLGGYAVVRGWEGKRAGWIRVARMAAVGVATFCGIYAVAWAATGYNPAAVLRSAMANQRQLEAVMDRPYPWTVPFDLLDFALGSGWVGIVLAGGYLWGQVRRREGDGRGLRLTLLVGAQLVAVAVSGMLAVETARVWIFLLPLLMIPAGLELSRWTPGRRTVAYLALLLVLLAVSRNVAFIYHPSGAG